MNRRNQKREASTAFAAVNPNVSSVCCLCPSVLMYCLAEKLQPADQTRRRFVYCGSYRFWSSGLLNRSTTLARIFRRVAPLATQGTVSNSLQQNLHDAGLRSEADSRGSFAQ